MVRCSREFKATKSSGRRFASSIKWIVLHDEEAWTARGAAAWFANHASQGSAQLCVDDKECYRTLSDLDIPWGAPGANTNGLHIEQAGFAAWKKWQWLKHRRQLNKVADRVAHWCVRYNIPPRFVDASELRAGKKGVTTHAEVSKAFGGTHTDPGFFYPRRRVMRKIRRRVAEIRKAQRA